MTRICVATADGRAYYAIVSRLRSAGLPFLSLRPGDRGHECELVLTTAAEAGMFGAQTILLEDLDENPDIVRGQILSKMWEGKRTLLVGLDPGSRIGMASFFGETRLGLHTFNSRSTACARVVQLVERVPSRRSVVRIGDGDPAMAAWLAEYLAARLPKTIVEIVDEAGTSRNMRMKGLQRDQGSAAKIAFRRGSQFRMGRQAPRTR